MPLWLAITLTAISLPIGFVIFTLLMAWIDPWGRRTP